MPKFIPFFLTDLKSKPHQSCFPSKESYFCRHWRIPYYVCWKKFLLFPTQTKVENFDLEQSTLWFLLTNYLLNPSSLNTFATWLKRPQHLPTLNHWTTLRNKGSNALPPLTPLIFIQPTLPLRCLWWTMKIKMLSLVWIHHVSFQNITLKNHLWA